MMDLEHAQSQDYSLRKPVARRTTAPSRRLDLVEDALRALQAAIWLRQDGYEVLALGADSVASPHVQIARPLAPGLLEALGPGSSLTCEGCQWQVMRYGVRVTWVEARA